MGRTIDYSQINPRILGNIYEQFLGYVIEIKEGRARSPGQPGHAAKRRKLLHARIRHEVPRGALRRQALALIRS